MSGLLELRNVFKSFDGKALLRDVSFEIAPGEIASLLGPSGSGKTTLLRIIAGLEESESGSVFLAGHDLQHVPTHLRGLGLMFQDLALFPHRNVFDNVAFGLRMQKLPRADIATRVQECLKLVGLEGFGPRDVNLLSGGEQQRVALARALAPRPRFLMFDEPMGALDRVLREQLVVDVRAILKQLGQTSLYVTHDQNEAFAIADRVMLVHEGQIVQTGAPRDVYEHPANAFVARFLGLNNLIRGRFIKVNVEWTSVETEEGIFTPRQGKISSQRNVDVLLRPDAARQIISSPEQSGVSPDTAAPRENSIEGKVVEARFQIGQLRVTVESRHKRRLTFDWDTPIAAATRVLILLDPEKMAVLESGEI